MAYDILEPEPAQAPAAVPNLGTDSDIARRVLGVRAAVEASQQKPQPASGAGFDVIEEPQASGQGAGFDFLEPLAGLSESPQTALAHEMGRYRNEMEPNPAGAFTKLQGPNLDEPLVNFPKVGSAQTLADALDTLRAFSGSSGLVRATTPVAAIPDDRSAMDRLGEMPPAEPTRAEKIAAGAINVPSEVASGFTSPKNIALLAGTAGVGSMPKLLQALVSAGFAIDMGRATPELLDRIKKAEESGDEQALTEAVGHLVANTGMAAGAGVHGIKGARASLKPERGVETPAPAPAQAKGFDIVEAPPQQPANVTPDALAELQAALRGESEQSVRLRPTQDNASPIRENPGQPSGQGQVQQTGQGDRGGDVEQAAPAGHQPVEPGGPARQTPPGNEVHGAPLTQEEAAGDEQTRTLLANRAKDYSGMSELELQLMEEMGDQGARSERKNRLVRRYLERSKVAQAGEGLAQEATAAAKPPPDRAGSEATYTIADAASDAGGVGAPPLADALEAMAGGRRASQFLSAWSGGRGEYDGLADILEQLRMAAEGGRGRAEFLRMAKAYERAFKPGGRANIDQNLDGIQNNARETGAAPLGGVPDSAGELIGRLWNHALGRTEPPRLSPEEHAMALHDVASSSAGRSVTQNGGAGLRVDSLQVGDRLGLRGAGFQVSSIDPDTGAVRLAATGEGRGNPEQFGPRPELKPDLTRTIYPDRGSFRPVDKGSTAGDTSSRELPRNAVDRAVADLRSAIDGVFPGIGRSLRILRRPDETAGVPVQRSERERDRAWRVFEKAFGRKIVLVESEKGAPLPFQGVTLAGHARVLFMDARRFNSQSVLGHEFLESIAIENPALFEKLRADLVPLMREFGGYKRQLDEIRASHGLEEASTLDAQRELIADFVGDCLGDRRFLSRLREANPGVFQKLANALIDFLSKVKEKLRPYGAGRWFNDVEAAEGRVMAALDEARGGRPLPPEEPAFSLSPDRTAANRELNELRRREDFKGLDAHERERMRALEAELGQSDLFETEAKAAADVEAEKSAREQRDEIAARQSKRLTAGQMETQEKIFPQEGQQSFFSLGEDLDNLGRRIAGMEARGEEVPGELRDRYARLAEDFMGPSAARVDAGLEARPIPAASGGPGARRRTVFRAEERLPRAGLRDVLASLNAWRGRVGDWLGRRHERQAAATGKDAADNRADRAGNMAANHIRLELNRAFETAKGEVRKPHELREYALSFVIEASGDRGALSEMREQILASDFAKTKWGKRAVAAMRYGITHWQTLVPVAAEYERITTMQREAELNRGLNSRQWEGGYVHHSWEEVPKAELLSERGADPTRPMGAGTPFTRAREFTTLAEGIAAGGIPKSLNAVALLAKRVGDGQRKLNEIAWLEGLMDVTDPVSHEPLVLQAHRVPQAGHSKDLMGGDQFNPDRGPAAPIWVRKPPPGYVAQTVGDVEIDVKRGFDGIITDVTAPSWFQGGAVRGGIQKTVAFAKSATLLFDTFHLGRIGLWKTVLTGKPTYDRGLTLLDYTEADIRSMAARGEIPQGWTADLVENKRRLELGLRAGLNVGGIVDNMHTEWVAALPGIGRFNHFLFKEYQRGAVVEAWLLEFNRMRKALRQSTEAQVAGRVTHDLNLRFGNLGRQGWATSRTMQDFARLLFLAPQWNEGLVRSEVGALGQLIRAPLESIQQRRLVAGTLLKGTGLMIAGTFLANQILNFVTRGKPTWENEEEGWDKKISAWIPDQVGNSSGFFLNPLALPAEYTHMINERLHQSKDTADAAWRMANSRFSGAARAILILGTRKDALGRSLKPGEVTGAFAKALVPVPIGVGAIGAAGKQIATGQKSEQYPGQFQRQVMSSMGVKADRAPSPEQRIRALAREFNQSKGIVPSAEFYAGDYDEFTKALRIGNDSDARDYLEELLKKKTAREVYDHFRRWAAAPYTGQRLREAEFLRGLTPDQRTAWTQAGEARRALAARAAQMVRQLVQERSPQGAQR